MSRGWVLTDWYTAMARQHRTLQAVDEITGLGFKTCLPPLTYGLTVILVKFDIWTDEWWRINRARNVAGLLMDGWVKWPVAITHDRLAVIRADLEKERVGYLRVGRQGLPRSTEFMAYPHAALRLYSRTSPIQRGMLRKRVARQATQAPNTLC